MVYLKKGVGENGMGRALWRGQAAERGADCRIHSKPAMGESEWFFARSYGVQPSYDYSTCSGQPGWNVKYKKGGRALCTLYPMPGFFIALVTIGAKEETEAELLAPTFTNHVQELMKTAARVMGARWLMIHVTDEQVLDDVKRLIRIRYKIRGVK